MGPLHVIIGFTPDGQPLRDHYNNVLVFKTREDAFRCGAAQVSRLVAAKVPKPKAQTRTTPGEAP
jgi:hypothetical protein